MLNDEEEKDHKIEIYKLKNYKTWEKTKIFPLKDVESEEEVQNDNAN